MTQVYSIINMIRLAAPNVFQADKNPFCTNGLA